MSWRRPQLLVRVLVLALVPVLGALVLPTSAQAGVHRDVTPPGDIPDSQVYIDFHSPDSKYTIKVPEGWARTDLATGATFTDKLNGVRVEDRAARAAPTKASVKATDVRALRATARRFRLTGVKTVHRHAGTAVLVTYLTQSAADPVTGKRRAEAVEIYEFWKAGTLATITLSSAKGADNVDPWRTVTNGFTWSG